jgi:hypothetical protein
LRLAVACTAAKALWLFAAVGGYAVVAWITGHPLHPADTAALGTIAIGVMLLYGAIWHRIHRHHTVYGGARWVGDSTSRSHAVTTDDLRRIHLAETADGWELSLVSANSTTLCLPLGLLEGNPRLWNLVYNGLRHSVAAGAVADPRTRELLRLPVGRSAQ